MKHIFGEAGFESQGSQFVRCLHNVCHLRLMGRISIAIESTVDSSMNGKHLRGSDSSIMAHMKSGAIGLQHVDAHLISELSKSE